MSYKYSKKLLEHFNNPKNAGRMENPDGIGELGDLECGDYFKFFIKVKDNKVIDVKYQIFGCPAAIGLSSLVSTLAIGKTLGEALQIKDIDAVNAAGGIPDSKFHCSNYAASTLHKAIKDYYRKVFIKSGVNLLLE